MTLKELFKKVEIYNEMAELMNTQKARIYFADTTLCCSYGEHFTNFADLRKFVRKEYWKDIADKVLTDNRWEFDNEVTITTRFNDTITFTAELVA